MEELAKMTPVSPPTVNRNTKPIDQYMGASKKMKEPFIVANQLKTLTPVGIAMIIVAAVK
jgi:hypothetical protein